MKMKKNSSFPPLPPKCDYFCKIGSLTIFGVGDILGETWEVDKAEGRVRRAIALICRAAWLEEAERYSLGFELNVNRSNKAADNALKWRDWGINA